MTRNWIATASRTLSMVRSSSAGPRRQRSGLRLENLESRLSLSGFAAPAIVGQHIGTGVASIKQGPVEVRPADLNPQPLPPGYAVDPEVVGSHIGSNMVQGAHIGSPMIVGQHIG
jgi:hypothetical protein